MGKFFCLLVSIYVCMFYLFSKDLNPRWKLMGKCQRQFLTKTLALLLSISSRWSRRQRWRRIKRKRSNEQQHISMWCVHSTYCIQCFTDIEFGNRLHEENTEIRYNLYLKLFAFGHFFRLTDMSMRFHNSASAIWYKHDNTLMFCVQCFLDFPHTNY